MNHQKDEELKNLLDELDPAYESKEELKIGHILDQYGIPFFYKQATVIYNDGKNEIWKPTFTLPQYGCHVIDYVAGHSGQNTDDIIQQHKQIYDYNQIPATVLGPKDLDKPDFQDELYEKLQQEFQRMHNLSLYQML